MKGVNPPINDDSEWHELIEEEYNYTLNIPSTDDFQFIYIGIEDEKGNVLFRVDLKEYTPQVVANFKSFDKPFK